MNQFISTAKSLTQSGDEFISKFGPLEFHKKAHELLSNAKLHEKFHFAELVKDSFRDDFNKKQNYAFAQFSDLPLTVASGEHCFMDVYFWRRRPTVIHNHHFTGAFQCVEGVNVDYEFEFTPKRKIGLYHELGELKLKEERKILKGDIAPINYLDQFIHQNHHQAELTINICFRTPDVGESHLSHYLYSGLRYEKHPDLLNRNHRLKNFLYMGEFHLDDLDLTVDDALCFLLEHYHSQSGSRPFMALNLKLEKMVREELGIDLGPLLQIHRERMDELESLYD